MRRLLLALLVVLSPVLCCAQPAGFVITNHLTGLNQPTCMAFSPNGRLYVGEKAGTIKVFNGSSFTGTFASIPCSSTSERGVLGLAFDPSFSTNHFLYVYYTTNAASPKNRVSRFTELNNQVVPGSEQIVIDDIASDAGNHNAGCIRFGLDGKLYVATGDGGSTPANGQNLNNLSGKILRINADGSIPNDNPFFNQVGKRGEILLYGLRNPFRFSFRPGTNTLYVADVGQNTWEEVNVGVPGGNYGWNTHEGTTSSPGFLNPIHEYNHNGGNASITGGCFVGNRWPLAWQSRYLFADYVMSSVRWIEVTGANVVTSNGDFAALDSPVDFALGPDGAVYVVSITGAIKRIAYRPVPVSVTGLNIYGGLAGSATVTLDVEAPAAGQNIALLSSNPTVLTVPATLTIAPGQISGAFGINTVAVATNQTSVVSATANGVTKSKTIYVLPAKLASFTLEPLALVGGNSSSATIGLQGKAPNGGRTVSLSSGNPTVAQVPESVTVAAGASTAGFVVTSSPVLTDNNVSISASLGSTTLFRTLAVVVQLHRISSLTMTPNPTASGAPTVGQVTITRPAPAGGLVIAIADNASVVTTPGSVTVPAGATSRTFGISTTAVNTSYNVNIQASVGISVVNSTLVLSPCPIQSLASYPATTPGGLSTNGQVILRNATPSGGAIVTLSDSSQWATLPGSVAVPQGETTGNFVISTLPVTQNVIVTFTSGYQGSYRSATMTITNVAAIQSLSMNPASFKGGSGSVGTVSLTKNAAPGGLTVGISDNLSVLITPTTIRVGSGAKTQTFAATSTTVAVVTVGTVIATANGISRTATVTLTP